MLFGGFLNGPQFFFCYSIVTVVILGVKILLNLQSFIVGSKNCLLFVQKSVIFCFMYCH